MKLEQYQEQQQLPKSWLWLAPAIMACILLVISQYNPLLFHTLAELFAVFVAICLSVVIWQTYHLTRNHFLMFLGCGYFWVGLLDLAHMLTYKGMALTGMSGASAVEFWLGARYLEAAVLCIAPVFIGRAIKRPLVFSVTGVVATGLALSVVYGFFPVSYVEGQGLTFFKKASEFVIIAVLLYALWSYRQHRHSMDRQSYVLLSTSILLTVCAELAFTLYVGLFDLPNVIGHIFKLISFWLIFLVMVKTTLHEPFRVLTRFVSTYDAIPDVTVLVGNNGVIQQANRAAVKFARAEMDEILGRHCHEIFHDPGIIEDDCPICRNIHTGTEIASREIYIEGSNHWLDYSLTAVTIGGASEGMVHVIHDVSEKKLAQRALRDADDQFRLLLDSTGEAIYGVNTDGICTFVNPACVNLLGYEHAEELLGQKIHDLIHHTRIDGRPCEKEDCNIRYTRHSGEKNHVENEIMWRKDGSSFPVEYWSYPIIREGEIIGVVGTFVDITERLKEHREKESLHSQLQHSQKMEAIGQLTGGIAHDFNNILACVLGYAALANERAAQLDDEKLGGYLQEITNSGERARDLISQMLVFSRKDSVKEIKAVSLQPLVKEAVKMLQASLPASIKIELDLADDLPVVNIDPVGFHQVLMNLCINARDAMDSKGIIRIKLRHPLSRERQRCASCHEIFETSGVELVVRDTGEGMDASMARRIFDPFFTTKDVGKGTGMGLSVVHGIVHKMAGHISISTMPGEGTAFHVWFPESVSEQESSEESATREAGAINGSGTLLLVEDELGVASFLEEMLGLHGYEVFVKTSAEDALEFMQNDDRAASVNLVLTDQTMPGMTGVEMARLLTEGNTGVPIILMTGYIPEIDADEMYSVGIRQIIQKPMDSDVLLTEIRDCLAADAEIASQS